MEGLGQGQRSFTLEELAAFNGTDDKPIYIALKGIVYDITSHESGRDLYGPGTRYNIWAGKDATRSLATMDFNQTGCLVSDLNAEQLETLEQWVEKYRSKYQVVGILVDQ